MDLDKRDELVDELLDDIEEALRYKDGDEEIMRLISHFRSLCQECGRFECTEECLS